MRAVIVIWMFLVAVLFSRCQFSKNRTSDKKSKESILPYKIGEYGYDLAFLKKELKLVELVNGETRLVVVPKYQGRVMTSSSKGLKGHSYGWINYDLIASAKIDEHANPYGGEERIWLGPEGGQFSVFYKKGSPVGHEQWTIPAALDHEPFTVIGINPESVTLEKKVELENYSGTKFKAKITRTLSLLGNSEIMANLRMEFGKSVSVVGYQSVNCLKNTGDNCWNKSSGALSIWILSMLKASPYVTVVIPYKKEGKKMIVNDYFHNIPENRLKVAEKAVYFRVDGKFRSKIGISPLHSFPCLGSYDANNKVLSILSFSLAENSKDYVNSSLVKYQEDPFSGDVINSYNDGPLSNGSQIGELYELETSSPAAFLKPGDEITYINRMYHFEGNEADLNTLAKSILNVPLSEIINAYNIRN